VRRARAEAGADDEEGELTKKELADIKAWAEFGGQHDMPQQGWSDVLDLIAEVERLTERECKGDRDACYCDFHFDYGDKPIE
jgi:hypothetical protein